MPHHFEAISPTVQEQAGPNNPAISTRKITEPVRASDMGINEVLLPYAAAGALLGAIAAVTTLSIFSRKGKNPGSEPNLNLTWGCLQNIQGKDGALPRGIGSMNCGEKNTQNCTYKLVKRGDGSTTQEGTCALQ